MSGWLLIEAKRKLFSGPEIWRYSMKKSKSKRDHDRESRIEMEIVVDAYNSDYQLCQTTCCGRFGVGDDELLDFYFDPLDLTRTLFNGDVVPCPFCGKQGWDFVEINDIAQMPAEWRWAAPLELS